MKINVVDKTEKIKLGKYYELRGNFVEQTDEDGNISYTCDMFRTTDSTKTFDYLYGIDYLSNTKYVEENYNTLLKVDEEKANQYLASTSDTYGITVQEILEKRAEVVESIASF